MPIGPRFREILNAYAPIAFTRKNCHMLGPIGIPGCVAAPGAFNWFSGHMDLLRVPSPQNGVEQMFGQGANKCSDFGKKWKKSVHKKFTKNFSKTLDFLKIPAGSTIVGRTNRTPNPLLYHIPHVLSIGKINKNLPPRRAVFVLFTQERNILSRRQFR